MNLAGKTLSFDEGDVLLINDSDRDAFLPYTAYFTEVRVDEYTVRRYLESHGGAYGVDISTPPEYLSELFTHIALLRNVMHPVNSGSVIHAPFREQVLFSCLAVFALKKGFLPLLQEGLLSVASKVRNIICSDLSRQWRLRDVCVCLYMSESLLKKKLKEEGWTFSE